MSTNDQQKSEREFSSHWAGSREPDTQAGRDWETAREMDEAGKLPAHGRDAGKEEERMRLPGALSRQKLALTPAAGAANPRKPSQPVKERQAAGGSGKGTSHSGYQLP